VIDDLGILYNKNSVKIINNIQDCELSLSQSTNIGLIVTELVSNALKYAFDDENQNSIKNPTLEVTLIQEENINLTVLDNGKGFDKDFEINQNTSFGLFIIKKMVEQNGTFTYKFEKNKTKFIIEIE
jgi:two-component sensor histidine kinase